MVAFQVTFLGACFLAAFWDFVFFKIPNELVLFIVALFAAKVFLFEKMDQAFVPAGVFAAVLVVGFALFFFKVMGAGDVKLIAACSLWTAGEHYGLFLLAMGLAGGVLGLIYHFWSDRLASVRMGCANLLKRFLLMQQALEEEPLIQDQGVKKKVLVPYGVAVFVGAAAMMLRTI